MPDSPTIESRLAESPTSESPVLARLDAVSFLYGRTTALDGVSLTIRAGEYIAIVGRNGSGKSTLGRVLSGLVAPDDGRVELMGREVYSGSSPAQAGANAAEYRAARRDIGLVLQNPADQIVTTVVEDDVAFGPENLGLEPDVITGRVREALEAVDMTRFAQADPDRLSGGQQQRVAIAGALAMHPRLLILDEPTAMLDATGREDVMRAIDATHRSGTAIVHITHTPKQAAQASRVIELRDGRIVYDGPSAASPFCAAPRHHDSPAASADTQVGTHAATYARPAVASITDASTAPDTSSATDAFRVENASYRYRDAAAGSWALRHVSLTVRRGEFVALTGRNGMGKSTLATLLCGVDAPTEGTVRVFGTPTATARQRRSLRGRVGYVMQHPERQLFAEHVEDDIAFGPTSLGLPTSEVRRRVQAAMDLLGIAHLANRVPWELSGGQQRLVAIAGVVAMEPEAIVLDEPTAGLDLEAAARVLDALRALHAEGRTIVMITHGDTSAASRTIRLDECVETDTRAGDARTTDARTTDARTTDDVADDGSADATTPSSADAPHRIPAQNRAPLARLDPRALIVGTLVGMVGMFFVSTPLQLLWAFLGVCAVVALSPRSLRGTLRNCHGMLASVLVLGLLNVFFVRSGTPLAHIGSLPITDEGMRNAVIYSLRFVFVLVLGLAMTACTTPTKLTDAGAAMLSPLSRLGVHVDEISLVMSLALRFMPVMGAELRTLSIAQATRGGDVASGSPAKRCRAVMALIVPMCAAALRHAEMLGTALDARCYEGGAHRTHWHRSRWGIHDAIALLAVVGWMAALLLLPRLVTILAA